MTGYSIILGLLILVLLPRLILGQPKLDTEEREPRRRRASDRLRRSRTSLPNIKSC